MKRNNLHSLALSALLFFSCSSPESQPAQKYPQELPPPVETADKGKTIFEEKCVLCHGADGTAGMAGAADLQKSRLDTTAVLQIITHGRNGMAAFKEQLGAGEIEQVTNYILSLRK